MSGRDLGASARQRLLDQSRAQNRPFQELLQYFAMERFLYRLAKSPHGDRFILKGALLLTAWRAPASRPTMDIDLAGRTDNRPEDIKAIVSAGLTRAYWDDPARVLQWRAFVRRSRFVETEGDLMRLVDEIRPFLLPVLSKIATEKSFNAQWEPSGPWE